MYMYIHVHRNIPYYVIYILYIYVYILVLYTCYTCSLVPRLSLFLAIIPFDTPERKAEALRRNNILLNFPQSTCPITYHLRNTFWFTRSRLGSHMYIYIHVHVHEHVHCAQTGRVGFRLYDKKRCKPCTNQFNSLAFL